MRLKFSFSLSLFFLLITFFVPNFAFAATYTLSGHVQNSSGIAVDLATIEVKRSSTNAVVATTTTNSSGNYTLDIEEGTYNIQITPQAGSGFGSAITYNKSVNNNTVLDFSLTPSGTARISGYLYDPTGFPLSNQQIILSGNGSVSVTTDNNGYYSLQATVGTYTLFITADANEDINAPSYYFISKSNFVVTQSIDEFNLTLPAKKVTVHIEDAAGVGVENVVLTTNQVTEPNLALNSIITDANGYSYYQSSPASVTDQNGVVELWLFPSNAPTKYTLTATPPNGSVYSPVTVSNVTVTDDTTRTITLPSTVTLSGHLYDATGAPLSNQQIILSGNGQVTTTTNNTGFYTLSVSPGTYTLMVTADANEGMNAPSYYFISKSNFVISQNINNFDLSLPAKKVTVQVENAAGGGISNVVLTTNQVTEPDLTLNSAITDANGYSYYQSSPASVTDQDGKVVLWLFPSNASTKYTLTATPPNGSIYSPVTVSNVTVTADTNRTITLPSTVTVSGHLYDPLGSPLSNQQIILSGNGNISTTTNNSGFYSLQASTGTYTLLITSDANEGVNAPFYYYITKSNFILTDNLNNFDLTLPAKKVTVFVENAGGVGIPNVVLTTNQVTEPDLILNPSISDASGYSYYQSSPAAITNQNGMVELWLFPSNASTKYVLSATPPVGGIYSPFEVSNITVTDNKTEVISLEYNHSAPVTTVALETEHADGTYSNPTTVTLAASAAAGYTIANIYYKIDGGAQQTYTDPFSVTGTGEHTIEYWSVDNTGVPESPKTKTFTIYLNQAPEVDPFAGATIDRGQTFTANSFFTDPDSTSWTATVDYDDGIGEEPLTLNPDKTFTLSHQYNTAGEYTVTVVVRDNQQATGTTLATVTVVVPNPVTTTYTSSADTYIRSGAPNQNEGSGQFMRIQASGDNRSLVRFDQTAMQQEIGNKEVLSAKLRVTIVDNGNNWGATGRTIDVHRLLANWTEGNGTETDRGIGSGATWNCATDSAIENQAKNCTGTTEWEMGEPNNPAVHPWIQTPTATQTITNNQTDVVEFDVTEDVKAFMNGTNQNNGWIIKKTAEGQNGRVSFGTKESSSVPRLVVTYQP